MKTTIDGMPTARRFPPPWTVEEHNDACFIVRDKNGQALGYFYFEDEPGRALRGQVRTRDEARPLVERERPHRERLDASNRPTHIADKKYRLRDGWQNHGRRWRRAA